MEAVFQSSQVLANGIFDVRQRLFLSVSFRSALLPARDRHMVRSIIMGTRKVTFGYTIDHQGEVVMATSAVSEDEPHAAPMWVVRHDYDAEGRLCEVHRPQDAVAAHEPPQQPAAAFAAK